MVKYRQVAMGKKVNHVSPATPARVGPLYQQAQL